MSRTAALLFLLALPQDNRLPLPDEATQKRVERTIREIFKDEYAKKDAASRRAFVQRLLTQGKDGKDDPESRYGLLKEALEVASQSGDSAGALAAADELAAVFAVAANPFRKEALDRTKKAGVDPAALTEGYLKVAADALRSGEIDLAADAAKEADAAAQKAKKIPLVGKARAMSKEIAEQRAEAPKLAEARTKLGTAPGDPAANGVLGRHLCFKAGDWDQGLAHLAKGPDDLKALAAQDLAAPSAGAEQVKLGDGWWDAGEKEAAATKDACRRRAARWYQTALPGLTGLTRVRVERRLAELPAEARIVPPPPGLIGWWTFDEGSGDVARDSSGKNNHGKLVNGPAWMPGRAGTALSFDGKDDYVTFSAEHLPAANAPQTITWSLYFDAKPVGTHLISIGNMNPSSSVQVVHRPGSIVMTKYGGVVLARTPLGEEKTWHQYAYTYDGATHRLYVDGVLKDSTNVPANSAKPAFFDVGRWPGLNHCSGRLDDLRLFDRALSDAEIEALAGRK